MKHMNRITKYGAIDLQLFADDGGSGGEDDSAEDEEDDAEEDEDDDAEEKKFTQKDIDETVKKRLAREKRKWQREQQRKKEADPNGKGKTGDDGEDKGTKDAEAESRASKLEVKVACYEADVAKESIDDVAALAHAYMEADDTLDLEDAIEKVVKKYPHFKKGAADNETDDDAKGKSWGERQKGKKTTLSGVEAAFLKKNPGLKV